jgi:hypothetical protein
MCCWQGKTTNRVKIFFNDIGSMMITAIAIALPAVFIIGSVVLTMLLRGEMVVLAITSMLLYEIGSAMQ